MTPPMQRSASPGARAPWRSTGCVSRTRAWPGHEQSKAGKETLAWPCVACDVWVYSAFLLIIRGSAVLQCSKRRKRGPPTRFPFLALAKTQLAYSYLQHARPHVSGKWCKMRAPISTTYYACWRSKSKRVHRHVFVYGPASKQQPAGKIKPATESLHTQAEKLLNRALTA